MAGGGPGPSSRVNVFEARLKTDLAGVSNTLTLLPYKGNSILVNGQRVTVPGGGMTRLVGDNLITAAGADSGAAGAASTLYYVYVSNSIATFSPSSIRLSASAPTLVNGVKYLGAAGNALNWRFVGWVRLNATPNFESSDTNALIVNYYNRLDYTVFANPGYVNDNAQTEYAIPIGNWAKANGGTGSDCIVISNGEDIVFSQSIAITNADAVTAARTGVGIDSTAPTRAAVGYIAIFEEATTNNSVLLSEGVHTLSLYAMAFGAGAVNMVADFPRSGAAADPRGSMVVVNLKV